jgi:imidazolonepropionase-like amidohydrolase
MPPAVNQQIWQEFSEATCRFARAVHEGGGQVMLGTDAFWQTMYPGDLHGELEWLVDCGFQPRAALATVTVEPAHWLGADSLGVIAPGAVADLVILEGDPLVDIANTRRIRLVVRRGETRVPADLLDRARSAASALSR